MTRVTRVRIVDVAQSAGVSRATVTNALRGTGRMTSSTRQHVLSVAEALGYPLSGAAPETGRCRALALGVTTHGAEAWSFASIAYFNQVIGSAMAGAHARGYSLTVLPAAPADRRWHSLMADGVLLLDPQADDPVARLMREEGVPVVYLGRPPAPRPDDTWVDNDHTAATRGVLDALYDRGARRIALIAGPGSDHYTAASVLAYREWSGEHGNPPVVEPLDRPDLVEALLGGGCRRRPRVDAVYGLYDACGHLMLDAAARRGLRVPEDLMIACMSEDPAYTATTPPVTTLSHAPRRLAQLAAAALIQLVETGTARPPAVVPTHLTVRPSTG